MNYISLNNALASVVITILNNCDLTNKKILNLSYWPNVWIGLIWLFTLIYGTIFTKMAVRKQPGKVGDNMDIKNQIDQSSLLQESIVRIFSTYLACRLKIYPLGSRYFSASDYLFIAIKHDPASRLKYKMLISCDLQALSFRYFFNSSPFHFCPFALFLTSLGCENCISSKNVYSLTVAV